MFRPLCFAEGPLKRIGNSRFGPWPVQGTEEATEGGGRPVSGEEPRRQRGLGWEKGGGQELPNGVLIGVGDGRERGRRREWRFAGGGE